MLHLAVRPAAIVLTIKAVKTSFIVKTESVAAYAMMTVIALHMAVANLIA